MWFLHKILGKCNKFSFDIAFLYRMIIECELQILSSEFSFVFVYFKLSNWCCLRRAIENRTNERKKRNHFKSTQKFEFIQLFRAYISIIFQQNWLNVENEEKIIILNHQNTPKIDAWFFAPTVDRLSIGQHFSISIDFRASWFVLTFSTLLFLSTQK